METDPDHAVFSVSVEAHDRDDTSAVIKELAKGTDQLREALLEYGIPKDNVAAERYSLREHSRQNRYESEHRYAVEVEDPDAVGEVINVCADVGADSIGRISFTTSGERRGELYDEAVKKSVEEARREVERYTDAAGQTLGDPMWIATMSTRRSSFRQEYEMVVVDDTANAPSTQIDEERVSVMAAVTLKYVFESGNA